MLAMRLSCRTSIRTEAAARITLLQGTLDLLILRTLLFGPPHGQAIARAIQLQSGNYYSLRGAGADVWALLERGTTERDIVAELKARYLPDPAMGESVKRLLEELADERLVEPAPAGGAAASVRHPPAGATAGTQPYPRPVLEKYTDMRDYLLVDPLHDVDERGWPPATGDSS